MYLHKSMEIVHRPFTPELIFWVFVYPITFAHEYTTGGRKSRAVQVHPKEFIFFKLILTTNNIVPIHSDLRPTQRYLLPIVFQTQSITSRRSHGVSGVKVLCDIQPISKGIFLYRRPSSPRMLAQQTRRFEGFDILCLYKYIYVGATHTCCREIIRRRIGISLRGGLRGCFSDLHHRKCVRVVYILSVSCCHGLFTDCIFWCVSVREVFGTRGIAGYILPPLLFLINVFGCCAYLLSPYGPIEFTITYVLFPLSSRAVELFRSLQNVTYRYLLLNTYR